MDTTEEPEIVVLEDDTPENESTNPVIYAELLQRRETPNFSSPPGIRHHPYSHPIPGQGERRHPPPNSRSQSTSRGGSDYMAKLFSTRASQPLDDDEPSIVVLGTIHHRPGGSVPRPTPPPQQEFQRPRQSMTPARTEHNYTNTPQPPPRRNDLNSANNTPGASPVCRTERSYTNAPASTYIPGQSASTARPPSPLNATKKRVSFTTISSITTPPRIDQECQTYEAGVSRPVPTTPVRIVKDTSSVAIQTTEDAGSDGTQNTKTANPSTQKSPQVPEVPQAETDPLENLIKGVAESIAEQIRGRCKKNFKGENDSDRKRLMKALLEAKKGIKPDRSSFREVLELFSVIDAKNFPYEIDRLWSKDLEKVAYLEKEETLRLMVEELNGIEKKLVELDVKIREKCITEIEQLEYKEYATELATKYFKYQKFLGSECRVRSYIYATQTRTFDFSKTKIGSFPAVQKALEECLNAERDQFLKCETDFDSICTPLFSSIEALVRDAMKSNHFENTDEENLELAKKVYAELVKETKFRRMNDFWRSMLETIHCPSIEALERCDPANKNPALAARLERNDTVAREQLHELLSEYPTDEDNDSDVDDMEQILEEDAFNLQELAGEEDEEDPEDETDKDFIANDAVVPTESEGVDFAAILAQMHEITNDGRSDSFEASTLPLA